MNAPRLRFKDEKGLEFPAWAEKELGDVIVLMQSGVSRLLNDSDVGLPVIRSTNLLNGNLDVTDLKYWYTVDNQGVNLENYFLKEGDLLVNFINSLAQIGKVALYEDLLKRNTIFTTNIMRLSFKKDVDYRFIFCFFQTNDYVQHIQAITKPAVNQASFTTKEFKTLKIPFPSLSEQTKIANFLTAVDEKIAQLTQKGDLLARYKKGVMQQIFSQQLRFKDDDGREFPEWVEKSLGDVGIFKSGTGFPENMQGGDIGIPFYKVSDMNICGNDITMKLANHYVTNDQIKTMKVKVIKDYAIIFAKVGAAIFLERKRIANNFLIDNNMMAFIPDANIEFMKQCFDTLVLSKFAQVGALPSYNASDLSIIKVNIPSPPEQIKIANFLTALDDKVTHNQTQLNAMKQYKQGLLQQMFV